MIKITISFEGIVESICSGNEAIFLIGKSELFEAYLKDFHPDLEIEKTITLREVKFKLK